MARHSQHSGPTRLLTWALVVPDACSLLLGLAFKLPKRLGLSRWVGMSQLDSISRPKPLRGHRPGAPGILGGLAAVWAACELRDDQQPGLCRRRPAAAPEVVRAVPPERSGRVALLTVNTAIDEKLPSEANPG